jgi:deoxyadenosine/deoxycytidine kinase
MIARATPLPPRIIEIVGPAGAGKSTVLRSLSRRDPRIRAEIEVGRFDHASALAPRAFNLVPVALNLAVRAPRFLWDNARHIARLEGLDAVVTAPQLGSDEVVVLSEGPLFLMTRLFLAAEQLPTTSPWFREMWDTAVARWRGRLDLVVWLDAPDTVLLQRIRSRAKRHRMKAAGDAAAKQFLTDYRRGYHRVLCACPPARHLRLDSAASSPEQLADQILAELDGGAS